jgi:uroporphyrinogen-III synthase
VLVTRPADRADGLISALEAAGVDAVNVPAIDIRPAHEGGDLDAAARHRHGPGWW